MSDPILKPFVEAAAELRMSPERLRDYVQAGLIECHRTGDRGWIRFSGQQITDFLESTRVPAVRSGDAA